jgi:hypothetical protein
VNNKIGSGVGYSIGYFEVAELTSKINLQAEINYSAYAFVDNSVTKTTTTTTLTNLELPIMVKYRIVDAFSIGAGYQFNILNQQFRTKSVFTEVEGFDPVRNTDLPGSSSQGYFIDANFKTGSVLLGLRVLQNADDFYLPNKRSVNIGLYAAFAIFK